MQRLRHPRGAHPGKSAGTTAIMLYLVLFIVSEWMIPAREIMILLLLLLLLLMLSLSVVYTTWPCFDEMADSAHCIRVTASFR